MGVKIYHTRYELQAGYLKFKYASGLQNVDCSFKMSQFPLPLYGVKYHDLCALINQDHVDKIYSVLDTEPVEAPDTM